MALAVFGLHSTRYVGLGIPVIVGAFHGPLPPWDWIAKILFTAVTLGAAFKGGEVTPLFFIGATLGNALAWILPLPPSLLAGMGFAAVFAGAANTPIASAPFWRSSFSEPRRGRMPRLPACSAIFAPDTPESTARSGSEPPNTSPWHHQKRMIERACLPNP